jgi:hypothetical protein
MERRQWDAQIRVATPRGEAMSESNDLSKLDEFALLDDSALLSRRAEMRAELERLPPASPGHAALSALYDKSTEEIDDRARKAWSTAS